MSRQLKVTTASEKGTEKLGEKLAAVLKPGNTILLYGNLGAGKTVIARGIARGLGIEEIITSPTFVIMNRYKCPPPRSAPLYHFDLYRNPSAMEFEQLGFAEILNGNGFCVIEWAENLPAEFVGNSIGIEIKLSKENKNKREITIIANKEKATHIETEMEKGFRLKEIQETV